MTYRSENIDSVGFRRAALLTFLALDGINLPDTAAVSQPDAQPVPPWVQARRGLRRLTLPEAANVLIGVDPLDSEWRGDDQWREFEGAKRIIQEAVDDGEIQSIDIDFERNGELVFSVSDLRAWAISIGYVWPIPELAASIGRGLMHSATDAGGSSDLLKRFQDSERERIQLKQEVERLQFLVDEANARDGKLAEQAAEIAKLEVDFDSAQSEIRELKVEIGQGKSLSTWQKLVIGMAVERYGYQPEASRSPTATDISAALGSVGIDVTAETVRSCLRTAAESHLASRR